MMSIFNNLRRYHNLTGHDDYSEMESMEECSSRDDRRPVRARKVRQNQDSYLQYIRKQQFAEVSLRNKKRRLTFQKAAQVYIRSQLLEAVPISSGNQKYRSPAKLAKGLNPLLQFLAANKLKVTLRLNSREFHLIFAQVKRTVVLNRLLESAQVKLVTTMQTPRLLWRRSKFSFNRFWKLDLPLSVTRTRRQDQVLRGIDHKLFQSIANRRPMLLIRLMKRSEVNHELAVEWARQLENPQILNQLMLVDI